jgi:hypothetical protein
MQQAWEKWEMRKKFWLETLKQTETSEDLRITKKIILKWIFGNKVWGEDWIHLAQDRGRWDLLWTR